MALKVGESIRGNKHTNYGKLAVESGYSLASSKKPKQITETKSYKIALIGANAPLIEGLQSEINAIKNAMAQKDKSREDYRVLAGSLDILTKNYQLLSGGATERQVFVLPSEVVSRNTITTDEAHNVLPAQAETPQNGSTEP